MENNGEKTPKKQLKGKPFTSDDPRINREGRPKGVKNFTTKVKEALERMSEEDGLSYEDLLVKKILTKAMKQGDNKMIELIWNYLDGKPVSKNETEMNLNAPNPILVKFIGDEDNGDTEGV